MSDSDWMQGSQRLGNTTSRPPVLSLFFTCLCAATLVACSSQGRINEQSSEQSSALSINDNVYTGKKLRQVAVEVEPAHQDTQMLVQKLTERANTGVNAVGLAAPQIGISRAVFIYRLPVQAEGEKTPVFPSEWTPIYNPSYSPVGSDVKHLSEGCFSVPHFYSKSVPRFSRILFKHQKLDGSWEEKEVSGFEAQVLQHETDHLNGVLYIDKLESLGDLMFVPK